MRGSNKAVVAVTITIVTILCIAVLLSSSDENTADVSAIPVAEIPTGEIMLEYVNSLSRPKFDSTSVELQGNSLAERFLVAAANGAVNQYYKSVKGTLSTDKKAAVTYTIPTSETDDTITVTFLDADNRVIATRCIMVVSQGNGAYKLSDNTVINE